MLPSSDRLIDDAVETGGVSDFGPGGWREGLEALLDSAAQADLNELGAALFTSWLRDRLRRRLEVVDWADRHRDECGGDVEDPLFVTGLGRSGTTFSLELLAADPANRTLGKWEAEDPVPPPEAATFTTDPRIAACVARTEQIYDAVPALRAVHYERGDGPTECLALLGLAFRGCDFPGLFTLPGYMGWWLRADQRPAYEIHRAGLAVLQSRAPGPWVLKDPWHLLALDVLFDTYPGARVVVLHRRPSSVVPSLAGLSATTGADAMRNTPVPPAYWGQQYLEALGTAADRHLESREALPPDRFLDLSYEELVADPVATVATIYAFAGRSWTAAAESAVADLVVQRPKGRYGVHAYTLEGFGLTEGDVDARFASYTAAYAEYL